MFVLCKFNLGSPYINHTPTGSESPLAFANDIASTTQIASPLSSGSSTATPSNKPFHLSQNSAFNLALRSSTTFNAFQAAVAAGINGFSSPLQTPPVQSPLSLYTRFSERCEESSDYSSITAINNNTDNDNMDLINPYMRHHTFAAAAAQQNNTASVNLLNRSPPLHHHHQNHISNGFPDPSQMDYQNQLLDYHSAAAAAAYAANNNNHLTGPLMLLKNNNNNNNNNMDKMNSGCKSPRSVDDSSTPPPLLSSHENNNTNISQTSSRLQSESPDNCHSTLNQRSRYDNNSSPGVDSSKSFSVSQRSSEEAGNNSESSPPPSDYSPENLSSRKFTSSNTGHPLGIHNNNNIGLDHKLPLSFLGPPLAALHSMTEMKTGNVSGNAALNGSYGGQQNSHMIGENRSNSSGSNAGTTNTQTQGTANPHGIDTILSKPPPVTSAGLSALTGGGIPRFSIAAAAAGMAQYLSQNQGTPLKTHAGHMVDRTHLYWPGLQGLVANPMAWRERLSNTMTANLSQSHQHHSSNDKDGKKKHTRPTFSGQQIFALEKTFEQTKYLAGPERAKLAYALGMTESQVK
ncbi:hypothetical protein FF38_09703, partial [Lucilia cuprina]